MKRKTKKSLCSFQFLLIWVGAMVLFTPLLSLSVHGQEKPKYGGTFIVGAGGDPTNLSLTTVNILDTLAASSVFNLLVNLDFDLNPRPDLAESWKVSDNGLIYTFHLARNVSWHDGKPFTSADVKFTFMEVLRNHHAQGTLVLKSVESVETPGPYTVIFKLKYPYDPLMNFIGTQGFILPKHLYENSDIAKNPYNMRPIGTGPFIFKEWKKGSHITLEKNTKYFKKGKPYLDKIIIKIAPDSASRITAFEANEIDYLYYVNLPSSDVLRFRHRPGFVVTSKGHETFAAIMLMPFNLRRPPFNHLKVRQAIAHAIDRQYIEEKADYGLGKPAMGPIASATKWAFNPDVKRYDFNPKKAEQLLDEAGYGKRPEGIRFKTSIIADRGNFLHAKAAEIIRDYLGKIGIQAELKLMDRSTMVDATFKRWDFDMVVHGAATGPDPAMAVSRLYVSTNIKPIPFANAAGYANKEVDELFSLAERAPTVKKRSEYYFKLQDIIVKDLPVLWLSEYGLNSAWRDEFKGLHSWGSRSVNHYGEDVWWTKGKDTPSR